MKAISAVAAVILGSLVGYGAPAAAQPAPTPPAATPPAATPPAVPVSDACTADFNAMIADAQSICEEHGKIQKEHDVALTDPNADRKAAQTQLDEFERAHPVFRLCTVRTKTLTNSRRYYR